MIAERQRNIDLTTGSNYRAFVRHSLSLSLSLLDCVHKNAFEYVMRCYTDHHGYLDGCLFDDS
jgi:hypothetical protein